MKLDIQNAEPNFPIERGYAMSIVIKTFKGRKNVEAHLFRPDWDITEENNYDWDTLLGDPLPQAQEISGAQTRKVLMESFSLQERDQLLDYLKNRYSSRLVSIQSKPMNLPIPLGLNSLSSISTGKSIGKIYFEKIPNYPLPFAVHGLYDLAQHKPLMEMSEEEK